MPKALGTCTDYSLSVFNSALIYCFSSKRMMLFYLLIMLMYGNILVSNSSVIEPVK